MALRPNPTVDRLRFVARQYPDAVVLYWTMVAALELEGIHERIVEELGPHYATRHQLLEILGDLEPRLGWGPYDRYLPWLAARISRIYKQARREALTLPPGAMDEADVIITQADARAQDLARRLRAIAQWAQAEGVDLGRVDATTAVAEARAWEAERELGDIPQGRIVLDFEDGFTVQQLFTPDELEAEGHVMQHCVGDACEGYVPAVAAGDTEIYSVRDEHGRPHVTVEVNARTREVVQVRGKQNVDPIEPYWPYVGALLVEHLDMKPGDPPSTLVTMVEEAYDRRLEVRQSAEEAHEAVDEAVLAFAKGEYAQATEWAEDAARLESEWGDDPAMGPFLEWVKQAIRDVALAGEFALDGVPASAEHFEDVAAHLSGENGTGEDLEAALDLMDDRPAYAQALRAALAETKDWIPRLVAEGEEAKDAFSDMDFDLTRYGAIDGEQVEFVYDAGTFAGVDPQDPGPGLEAIARDFAYHHGLLEESDLEKYVAAYESAALEPRALSANVARRLW